MATKSTNIRIDENVKAEATALFASFGLGLSDAVNIFLRVAIEERGIPFPLKLRPSYPAATTVERHAAIRQLFGVAEQNPITKTDYKFKREESYDRKVFHR